MMRLFFGFFAVMSLAACGGGSSGDPKTNDLGEFNPPGQLASLTRDSALELTWVGANAEDDFQGYHVFGSTKSLDELQALVKYPKNASILKSQSIPRCQDNNAFFRAFGFPDTTDDCKSSVIPEKENKGLFVNSDANMGYIIQDDANDEDDSSDAESDENLLIDFNIPCNSLNETVEKGSVSLPPSGDGKTIGRSYCLVDQVYNGSKLTNIENGTTYSYMVVAVKGKDKNNISWISNVIDDTPAEQLFSSQVELKGGSNAQYVAFEIDATNFEETKKPTATSCNDNVCKISGTNAESTDGIYIARDSAIGGSFEFSQRLFVSTPTSSKMTLQYRGAQVSFNPHFAELHVDPVYLPQVPGDQASTGTYLAAGKKFAFNERAVFDFKYDLGNGTYRYGKVAITDLSFKDDEVAASTVTLDVTIVIQPDIDNPHYFHSAD